MNSFQKFINHPKIALLLTLLLVVVVRESCVILCRAIGIESASNIVGMVVMLILLLLWRVKRGWHHGLPSWLTDSSNRWLKDSGFAFLPVSAGAGLLLFGLGNEFWQVLMISIVSTLLPLWGFAYLANRWLANTSEKL